MNMGSYHQLSDHNNTPHQYIADYSMRQTGYTSSPLVWQTPNTNHHHHHQHHNRHQEIISSPQYGTPDASFLQKPSDGRSFPISSPQYGTPDASFLQKPNDGRGFPTSDSFHTPYSDNAVFANHSSSSRYGRPTPTTTSFPGSEPGLRHGVQARRSTPFGPTFGTSPARYSNRNPSGLFPDPRSPYFCCPNVQNGVPGVSQSSPGSCAIHRGVDGSRMVTPNSTSPRCRLFKEHASTSLTHMTSVTPVTYATSMTFSSATPTSSTTPASYATPARYISLNSATSVSSVAFVPGGRGRNLKQDGSRDGELVQGMTHNRNLETPKEKNRRQERRRRNGREMKGEGMVEQEELGKKMEGMELEGKTETSKENIRVNSLQDGMVDEEIEETIERAREEVLGKAKQETMGKDRNMLVKTKHEIKPGKERKLVETRREEILVKESEEMLGKEREWSIKERVEILEKSRQGAQGKDREMSHKVREEMQGKKDRAILPKDREMLDKDTNMIHKGKEIQGKDRAILPKDREMLLKDREMPLKDRDMLYKDMSLTRSKMLDKNRDELYKDSTMLDKARDMFDKDRDMFDKGRDMFDKGRDVLYKDRDVLYKDRDMLDKGRDTQGKDTAMLHKEMPPPSLEEGRDRDEVLEMEREEERERKIEDRIWRREQEKRSLETVLLSKMVLQGKTFVLAIADNSLKAEVGTAIEALGGRVSRNEANHWTYAVLTDLKRDSNSGTWYLDCRDPSLVQCAVDRYKNDVEMNSDAMAMTQSNGHATDVISQESKDSSTAAKEKRPTAPWIMTLIASRGAKMLKAAQQYQLQQQQQQQQQQQDVHQTTQEPQSTTTDCSTVPPCLRAQMTQMEYDACLRLANEEVARLQEADQLLLQVQDAGAFLQEQQDVLCQVQEVKKRLSHRRQKKVYSRIHQDNATLAIRVEHVDELYQPSHTDLKKNPRDQLKLPLSTLPTHPPRVLFTLEPSLSRDADTKPLVLVSTHDHSVVHLTEEDLSNGTLVTDAASSTETVIGNNDGSSCSRNGNNNNIIKACSITTNTFTTTTNNNNNAIYIPSTTNSCNSLPNTHQTISSVQDNSTPGSNHGQTTLQSNPAQPQRHKFEGSIPKYRRTKEAYCELCHRSFTVLRQHVLSTRHAQRAASSDSYRELNQFLDGFPTMTDFLTKINSNTTSNPNHGFLPSGTVASAHEEKESNNDLIHLSPRDEDSESAREKKEPNSDTTYLSLQGENLEPAKDSPKRQQEIPKLQQVVQGMSKLWSGLLNKRKQTKDINGADSPGNVFTTVCSVSGTGGPLTSDGKKGSSMKSIGNSNSSSNNSSSNSRINSNNDNRGSTEVVTRISIENSAANHDADQSSNNSNNNKNTGYSKHLGNSELFSQINTGNTAAKAADESKHTDRQTRDNADRLSRSFPITSTCIEEHQLRSAHQKKAENRDLGLKTNQMVNQVYTGVEASTGVAHSVVTLTDHAENCQHEKIKECQEYEECHECEPSKSVEKDKTDVLPLKMAVNVCRLSKSSNLLTEAVTENCRTENLITENNGQTFFTKVTGNNGQPFRKVTEQQSTSAVPRVSESCHKCPQVAALLLTEDEKNIRQEEEEEVQLEGGGEEEEYDEDSKTEVYLPAESIQHTEMSYTAEPSIEDISSKPNTEQPQKSGTAADETETYFHAEDSFEAELYESFGQSADTTHSVQALVTADFLEASETVSFVQASETVSFVQASETVSFVQTSETVRFLQASETVSFVQASDAVSFVQASETVSFVQASDSVSFVQSVIAGCTIDLTEFSPAEAYFQAEDGAQNDLESTSKADLKESSAGITSCIADMDLSSATEVYYEEANCFLSDSVTTEEVPNTANGELVERTFCTTNGEQTSQTTNREQMAIVERTFRTTNGEQMSQTTNGEQTSQTTNGEQTSLVEPTFRTTNGEQMSQTTTSERSLITNDELDSSFTHNSSSTEVYFHEAMDVKAVYTRTESSHEDPNITLVQDQSWFDAKPYNDLAEPDTNDFNASSNFPEEEEKEEEGRLKQDLTITEGNYFRFADPETRDGCARTRLLSGEQGNIVSTQRSYGDQNDTAAEDRGTKEVNIHTYVRFAEPEYPWNIEEEEAEPGTNAHSVRIDVSDLKPTGSDVSALQPTGSDVIVLQQTGSDVSDLQQTGSDVSDLQPTGSVIDLQPTGSDVNALKPTLVSNNVPQNIVSQNASRTESGQQLTIPTSEQYNNLSEVKVSTRHHDATTEPLNTRNSRSHTHTQPLNDLSRTRCQTGKPCPESAVNFLSYNVVEDSRSSTKQPNKVVESRNSSTQPGNEFTQRDVLLDMTRDDNHNDDALFTQPQTREPAEGEPSDRSKFTFTQTLLSRKALEKPSESSKQVVTFTQTLPSCKASEKPASKKVNSVLQLPNGCRRQFAGDSPARVSSDWSSDQHKPSVCTVLPHQHPSTTGRNTESSGLTDSPQRTPGRKRLKSDHREPREPPEQNIDGESVLGDTRSSSRPDPEGDGGSGRFLQILLATSDIKSKSRRQQNHVTLQTCKAVPDLNCVTKKNQGLERRKEKAKNKGRPIQDQNVGNGPHTNQDGLCGAQQNPLSNETENGETSRILLKIARHPQTGQFYIPSLPSSSSSASASSLFPSSRPRFVGKVLEAPVSTQSKERSRKSRLTENVASHVSEASTENEAVQSDLTRPLGLAAPPETTQEETEAKPLLSRSNNKSEVCSSSAGRSASKSREISSHEREDQRTVRRTSRRASRVTYNEDAMFDSIEFVLRNPKNSEPDTKNGLNQSIGKPKRRKRSFEELTAEDGCDQGCGLTRVDELYTLSHIDDAVVVLEGAHLNLVTNDQKRGGGKQEKGIGHIPAGSFVADTRNDAWHVPPGLTYSHSEGTWDQRQGHSDAGQGHYDAGQGHTNTGQGHSDTAQGHSDTGQGHSDAGQGFQQQKRPHRNLLSELNAVTATQNPGSRLPDLSSNPHSSSRLDDGQRRKKSHRISLERRKAHKELVAMLQHSETAEQPEGSSYDERSFVYSQDYCQQEKGCMNAKDLTKTKIQLENHHFHKDTSTSGWMKLKELSREKLDSGSNINGGEGADIFHYGSALTAGSDFATFPLNATTASDRFSWQPRKKEVRNGDVRNETRRNVLPWSPGRWSCVPSTITSLTNPPSSPTVAWGEEDDHFGEAARDSYSVSQSPRHVIGREGCFEGSVIDGDTERDNDIMFGRYQPQVPEFTSFSVSQSPRHVITREGCFEGNVIDGDIEREKHSMFGRYQPQVPEFSSFSVSQSPSHVIGRDGCFRDSVRDGDTERDKDIVFGRYRPQDFRDSVRDGDTERDKDIMFGRYQPLAHELFDYGRYQLHGLRDSVRDADTERDKAIMLGRYQPQVHEFTSNAWYSTIPAPRMRTEFAGLPIHTNNHNEEMVFAGEADKYQPAETSQRHDRGILSRYDFASEIPAANFMPSFHPVSYVDYDYQGVDWELQQAFQHQNRFLEGQREDLLWKPQNTGSEQEQRKDLTWLPQKTFSGQEQREELLWRPQNTFSEKEQREDLPWRPQGAFSEKEQREDLPWLPQNTVSEQEQNLPWRPQNTFSEQEQREDLPCLPKFSEQVQREDLPWLLKNTFTEQEQRAEDSQGRPRSRVFSPSTHPYQLPHQLLHPAPLTPSTHPPQFIPQPPQPSGPVIYDSPPSSHAPTLGYGSPYLRSSEKRDRRHQSAEHLCSSLETENASGACHLSSTQELAAARNHTQKTKVTKGQGLRKIKDGQGQGLRKVKDGQGQGFRKVKDGQGQGLRKVRDGQVKAVENSLNKLSVNCAKEEPSKKSTKSRGSHPSKSKEIREHQKTALSLHGREGRKAGTPFYSKKSRAVASLEVPRNAKPAAVASLGSQETNNARVEDLYKTEQEHDVGGSDIIASPDNRTMTSAARMGCNCTETQKDECKCTEIQCDDTLSEVSYHGENTFSLRRIMDCMHRNKQSAARSKV